MLKFKFDKKINRSLIILCVGAHSDDIEIGCGGTILRLLSEYDDVEVHWVVFGSSGRRNKEAVESANKFLANAKKRKIIIENFKDGFFPYRGEDLKTFFEKLKKRISPDLIFSHYRHDLHQDHRLISELTWNTYRDHFILEYEIIKYDGDIGSPNFFVYLDEKTCREKVGFILESFKSQKNKVWFTSDTFFSLLRIRGVESKSPVKYAEGFYCRKLVL
jgi:LmbE family N-acetylglucosaminyl deacetylase